MLTAIGRNGRWIHLGVLVILTSCGEASHELPENSVVTSGNTSALEDIEDLGVVNAAMPAENLLTSAQLTEDQFNTLVEMGYSNFISLRLPTETGAGWEETHAVEAGVSFTRITVDGADGLTRENVVALARALDDSGSDNTALYCGSSNRVGGLLALKAYWLDGAPREEALEIGRSAGLASLEGAVTELLNARVEHNTDDEP